MSLGVVVLVGNCHWGSCPTGIIVLGGLLSWWVVAPGVVVLQGNCPMGVIVLQGSCPQGSCPRISYITFKGIFQEIKQSLIPGVTATTSALDP